MEEDQDIIILFSNVFSSSANARLP
ncbi:MAG: hypothetical protein E7K43_00040 [Bacillus subtilis]|nr:hypothetical protein [Bacillus subtilis]